PRDRDDLRPVPPIATGERWHTAPTEFVEQGARSVPPPPVPYPPRRPPGRATARQVRGSGPASRAVTRPVPVRPTRNDHAPPGGCKPGAVGLTSWSGGRALAVQERVQAAPRSVEPSLRARGPGDAHRGHHRPR